MQHMNRAFRAVETLVKVDSEFVELCKSLYGQVDTALIYEDVFGKGVSVPKVEEMAEGAYNAQKLTLPKALQGDVANKIGHALHKPLEHKKLTAGFVATGVAANARGKAKGRRQGYEAALYGKSDEPKTLKRVGIGATLVGGALGVKELGEQAPKAFPNSARAARVGHLVESVKMPRFVTPKVRLGVVGGMLAGDAVATAMQARKPKQPTFKATGVTKYYSEVRPATAQELKGKHERHGFLRLRKRPVKQGWMMATEDTGPFLISTGPKNPDYTARQVKQFSSSVQKDLVEKPMPDLELAGTFSKFDDAKKQAFGYASVVKKNGLPVIDRQGDYIDADEMEKAAYEYVKKSRIGGDMHKRQMDEYGIDRAHHVSDLIESMVFTPEKCKAMGLPDEVAKNLEGHWWVGYQIHDDDTWEQVRKQGRTGFSVHGKGKRVETTLDEVIERVSAGS